MSDPVERKRVHMFKHSYQPFCDLLRESGIDFIQNRALFGAEGHKSAGQIFAGPFTVEILASTAALATVARVLIVWIKSRASRRVQIGTELIAEGMSPDEIVRLLREARSINVIDTNGHRGEPD